MREALFAPAEEEARGLMHLAQPAGEAASRHRLGWQLSLPVYLVAGHLRHGDERADLPWLHSGGRLLREYVGVEGFDGCQPVLGPVAQVHGAGDLLADSLALH